MAITQKVIRVGGIAVECFSPEEEKYPAPLLFVHGSSGGSWIWENFLAYLSSRGWTCYAPSLRGHYLSDPVEDWGEVGVDTYLEDVDRVVQWINRDFIYIGHSMGGMLGQKYAESRNPLKLILLQTGPPKSVVKKIDFNSFLKRGREQGRVITGKVMESDNDPKKLLGYMFDAGNVEPEILEMCHQKMGKESSRALQEMKEIEVDPQKVRCPVYVLGFDLKKIGVHFPLDLDQELARYYHAKELRIIEPGGHMFMLEKNWKDFARLIEGWLVE